MSLPASLPSPLTAYLREEISPLELAHLLDEHLHQMVGWLTESGEAWTEEQNSTYHHLRRLRDLMVEIAAHKPRRR